MSTHIPHVSAVEPLAALPREEGVPLLITSTAHGRSQAYARTQKARVLDANISAPRPPTCSSALPDPMKYTLFETVCSLKRTAPARTRSSRKKRGASPSTRRTLSGAFGTQKKSMGAGMSMPGKVLERERPMTEPYVHRFASVVTVYDALVQR